MKRRKRRRRRWKKMSRNTREYKVTQTATVPRVLELEKGYYSGRILPTHPPIPPTQADRKKK